MNRRGRVVARAVAALALVAAAAGALAATRNDEGSSGSPAASSATPTNATPTGAPPANPPPASAPAPRPNPLVLMISVDGLNPDALTALGAGETPGFTRLMAEGTSTLNARSAYELTITLPNHTGMLTGRGVAGSSGHGVAFNDDDGKTLAAIHGAYVPGVFDVAHDHGLGTAFFAEKDKFDFLLRSWDGRHGAPDTTGPDDGRDKTDVEDVAGADELVPRVEKSLLDPTTSLVFLHLAAPDRAGHADGWLGPSYLDAVRAVDRRLGSILDTIDAHPALRERVTILLTADHGGAKGATSHDDPTLLADYRVPFIAWGRGVAPAADLYRLNPERRDPADARPGYSGPQPVRNIDLADTALSLLGLPALAGVPSSTWPPLRLLALAGA